MNIFEAFAAMDRGERVFRPCDGRFLFKKDGKIFSGHPFEAQATLITDLMELDRCADWYMEACFADKGREPEVNHQYKPGDSLCKLDDEITAPEAFLAIEKYKEANQGLADKNIQLLKSNQEFLRMRRHAEDKFQALQDDMLKVIENYTSGVEDE